MQSLADDANPDPFHVALPVDLTKAVRPAIRLDESPHGSIALENEEY